MIAHCGSCYCFLSAVFFEFFYDSERSVVLFCTLAIRIKHTVKPTTAKTAATKSIIIPNASISTPQFGLRNYLYFGLLTYEV